MIDGYIQTVDYWRKERFVEEKSLAFVLIELSLALTLSNVRLEYASHPNGGKALTNLQVPAQV